jgi:hypothetical protein
MIILAIQLLLCLHLSKYSTYRVVIHTFIPAKNSVIYDCDGNVLALLCNSISSVVRLLHSIQTTDNNNNALRHTFSLLQKCLSSMVHTHS